MVLVGELEGKKPVEIPGCGMEVNIEMGLNPYRTNVENRVSS